MTCVNGFPESSLQSLIAEAFDRQTSDLLKYWHDRGHEKLTISHFLNVLRFVSQEGIRPARISELSGISQQGTSLLITELVSLGYVDRTPDPADKRAQVVRWSEKGLAVAWVTETWFRECEKNWRNHLGDQAVEGAFLTLQHVISEGREK
ncbi:MarR family winged helix-turn-helix transcriptional regulator [Corynebacterium kalinowskii]|uniref:MarR family winged helix-turn-helix transcriptional regulator n=1 Tax=Corynebacterium kalinowskii TaxID=2675216 RepID=UPI0012E2D100|nr:helix-turn-helix domain-containing protein [Corynebacterium kalinowskii]